MKRFLPVLAALSMFIAAPAFAADEATNLSANVNQTVVAEAPASAAVATGERMRLDLSDAQLEQLRSIKDKYFDDNVMKKAQLTILKHDLREELTKETVDRSAVMAIQTKINAAHADLSNARIAQVLDSQGVFTPDQRKMMHERALRAGFRHHRGGHGKGGCGGGGGGGGGWKHHGMHGMGGPGGHGGPGGRGFQAEGPRPLPPNASAELPDGPMPMDGPDGPDGDS